MALPDSWGLLWVFLSGAVVSGLVVTILGYGGAEQERVAAKALASPRGDAAASKDSSSSSSSSSSKNNSNNSKSNTNRHRSNGGGGSSSSSSNSSHSSNNSNNKSSRNNNSSSVNNNSGGSDANGLHENAATAVATDRGSFPVVRGIEEGRVVVGGARGGEGEGEPATPATTTAANASANAATATVTATTAAANINNSGARANRGVGVDSMSSTYAPPSPTLALDRRNKTVSRGDCNVVEGRTIGVGREGEGGEGGGGVGVGAMVGVEGGAEFVEATAAMEELIKKFDSLAEMLDGAEDEAEGLSAAESVWQTASEETKSRFEVLAREFEGSRSSFSRRYRDRVDGRRRREGGGSSDAGSRIAAIAADLKADSQVLEELYASLEDMLKSRGASFTARLLGGSSSASARSCLQPPPLENGAYRAPSTATHPCKTHGPPAPPLPGAAAASTCSTASGSVPEYGSGFVSDSVSSSFSTSGCSSVSNSVSDSVSKSVSNSVSASAYLGSDGGESGGGGSSGRARGGVGGGRGAAGSACFPARGGGAAGRSTKRRLPRPAPAPATAAPARPPVCGGDGFGRGGGGRGSGGGSSGGGGSAGRSGGCGASFAPQLASHVDGCTSVLSTTRPTAAAAAAAASGTAVAVSATKRVGHGSACSGGAMTSCSPEGWAGQDYGSKSMMWSSARGCHPKNYYADSSASINNSSSAGGVGSGANPLGGGGCSGVGGGGRGGGVSKSQRAAANAGPCGFPPSLPRPAGGGGVLQEARAFAPAQHLAVLRALLDEDGGGGGGGGDGVDSSGSDSDSDS